MDVYIDTNALLLPHTHKIDVFSEIRDLVLQAHEILILSGVMRELEDIANSKGEDKVAARVALKLIKENNFKIIESTKDVDSELINHTKDGNSIVVTNDAQLRKRLRENNVRALCMHDNRLIEC